MIDADADVLTAHSDSQSKLQMSEGMWRPPRCTPFYSNNMVEELITLNGGNASTSFILVDLFNQSKYRV